MAHAVMLDTNVYNDPTYKDKALSIRRLRVSSVVVQELLVVAKQEERKALIGEFNEKVSVGIGFVPNGQDWIEVGVCLAKLHQERIYDFGKLSKGEVNLLVRDALLARTAMQANAVLITADTNDFSKIKMIFKRLKFNSPSSFFGTRTK